MPLLDHFHGRIARKHDWPSFHSTWANIIMFALNDTLPQRFMAQVQVRLGQHAEGDVIEYDTEPDGDEPFHDGLYADPEKDSNMDGGLAVAVKPALFIPPEPEMLVPILSFSDAIEVKVYDLQRERRVVAVIEMVSPANKDLPDERETFALKSLGYIKAGIGLITIDIVTTKDFNLHDELIRVARADEKYRMAGSPATYAVAYRPVHRKEDNLLAIWPHLLDIGEKLPLLPLALMGFGCVKVDLEATYMEACKRSRIE